MQSCTNTIETLHTRIWRGRNRNWRFRLDFSIRSLSVITSYNHKHKQFALLCTRCTFTDNVSAVHYVCMYTPKLNFVDQNIYIA